MAERRRWVAGIHAVETAMAGGSSHVVRILADRRRRDARLARLIEHAERAGIPIERCSSAALKERVPGVRHQGVCAEVRGREVLDDDALRAHLDALDYPPLVLVLDGVQDPHNLGACLRSAAAAGADAVIIPRDRAARLTPTVERAAAGAVELVTLAAVTNLGRTLAALKEAGCWVIGTAGDAELPLYQADLTGALALVLGGEEKGLRPRTRSACDRLVSIPLHSGVESLNVSVATGVCLFEAVRQRES
jgi:23S rRNA (guanosine2251-2'-O)-methyltransferase